MTGVGWGVRVVGGVSSGSVYFINWGELEGWVDKSLSPPQIVLSFHFWIDFIFVDVCNGKVGDMDHYHSLIFRFPFGRLNAYFLFSILVF